jgi:TolB-like protein
MLDWRSFSGVFLLLILISTMSVVGAGQDLIPDPQNPSFPTFVSASERGATVVVIPFANLSGNLADNWLGAGFAETVSVDLKNQQDLSVLDGSAGAGREFLSDVSEVSSGQLANIGEQVGATWVVTGGYQRVGDRVRVTVRVVEVSSRTVVHTVKLDGLLGEIFSLQDQVSAVLNSPDLFTERTLQSARQLATPDTTSSADLSAVEGRQTEQLISPVMRGEGITLPGDVPPARGTTETRRVMPEDLTGTLSLGESAGVIPGRIVAAGVGRGPGVMPARVPEGPVIDGQIDDAAWQGAVRITEFVQMNPLEGAPASEQTEVYLAYDNTNFYVGVYAHYSDPTVIRANRVERDQTTNDDKLTVYFDPFMDQQRAYTFSVNGYGVQGDATLDLLGSRGGRRRSGPGQRGPGGNTPGVIPPGDASWDALYTSAGSVRADGWTAEMAIPFKSLRYPARDSGEIHRWGFQIVRTIEGKDERVVWSPVSRGIAGFLTQMGTLDGMTNLSASRNFEFLPTVTGFRAGSLDTNSGAFVDHDFSPEAGLNVKYGITSNLTADFTINPDFSQIESDQPQIAVNQRFPLFFSELRPFFLEGQEIFNIMAPINFVHTRTIVDPRVGAKITGKVGRSTLGILVGDDEAPGKREDVSDPAFGKTAQFLIGRYRYDLYGASYVGGLVADREFMGGYNRVAATDIRLRLGNTNTLDTVVTRSVTRDEDGVERSGGALGSMFRHNDRNLSLTAYQWHIGPDFRNQSGFVRRTDERRGSLNIAYRWWPENWIVNWGPRVNYERNYDFSGTLQDEVAGGGFDFTFARSISVGLGTERNMERFGGIDFWKSIHATSFTLNSSRRISLEGNFEWGDGIFFSNTPFLGQSSGGRILSSIRPFSRLQADVSVDFSQLRDPRIDTEVFDVKIFRAFTTYQFTERFLLRNIMEYNSFDKKLDANILFTYRLNSGTVLFVGYDDHYQQGDFIDFGETLAERFLVTNRLQRTNRAFFTKFSYLFRY